MGFTQKQKLFIKYYVDTLNASKSAILAGYSKRQSGDENLSNPDIRAEIDRKLKEKHMTPEEIKVRIKEIASTDLSEYIKFDRGPSGEEKTPYIDVEMVIADGKGHLIKGIKKTVAGTVVEFDDRLRALEMIAKVESMFNDNKPQDINVNVQVDGLENLLTKVYGSHDPDSDD